MQTDVRQHIRLIPLLNSLNTPNTPIRGGHNNKEGIHFHHFLNGLPFYLKTNKSTEFDFSCALLLWESDGDGDQHFAMEMETGI